MKNRITDLNDHLFAQMERLADDSLSGDKLDAEVKRTDAMVKIADKHRRQRSAWDTGGHTSR